MDKGLKSILTAIEQQPSDKLVDRFLALIADFKEEETKTLWALRLARVLIASHVDQAMRIAHMVFKNDRKNIEALDIVIECLRVKGRFGKAEVLKIERDKLRTHFEESEKRLQAGDAERLLASDMSEPQSIDLEDSSSAIETEFVDSQRGAKEVAERRGDTRLPQGVVAQSVPPEGERRQDVLPRLRESLPIHQDIFGAGATHHRHDPAAQSAKPTLRLDGLFSSREADELSPEDAVDLLFQENSVPNDNRVASPAAVHANKPRDLEPTARNSPSLSLDFSKVSNNSTERLRDPPEVATSDLGVAIEMFDYYWQQGFVDEARGLLAQIAPVAGLEPWWKARNALVEKSNIGFSPKTQAQEVSIPPINDFWQPLHAELANLAKRIGAQGLVRQEDVPALFRGENLPPEAWEALLRLLRVQEGSTPAEKLARQWEIVSGVWGSEPRQDCAHLLETLALTRASTGFWGLYLDSLLVGGRARQSLSEIRAFLPERPRLAWCKVAYTRLQIIWRRLGLRTLIWCEDDGVWPLLKILSERPSPTLASVVVIGGDVAPPTDKID